MGVDAHHSFDWTNNDGTTETQKQADRVFAEGERLEREFDDDDQTAGVCHVVTGECDGNCRRNDESTRRLVWELSKLFPEQTFELRTRWYVDDDPVISDYFRAGRAVSCLEVRVVYRPGSEDDFAEIAPCQVCGGMVEHEYGCASRNDSKPSGAYRALTCDDLPGGAERWRLS